ncbi:uncharacterized protein F4807DRAFT_450379 [Annulohypoxylon truncatum]|uniref:uncharacterized protein n=1 Tax=Annulohypoxylon truncatum TaxID=327061 RepID=UPI002008051C|nr:uncharacterized protein F4807DRAFT_450379 [Annulohypoxylon truncatum]KAI1212828.1 hypothetical protein F4807DRAFT_450379 [Annulohypoxylon truncatum]
MADLLRLSRPWLLSSLRSRAPSPVLSPLCRSFSTTPSLSRTIGKGHKQHEPAVTPLLPKSLVVPPIWRFPRSPTKFVHMLWLILKTRFYDLRALMSMKAMSMDPMKLSRPRFKYRKSTFVPAAKALHIQMSEAMAAGDKETLRVVCTGELYNKLASAIDSRPKGVRSEWELVRYEKSWRYPRLADAKLGTQPHSRDKALLQQAIVSIASVQRIARYDDSKGGIMIDGSERVRHMVEHIVIQCIINPYTFEAGPWQIWGTLPESTYESILEEEEDLAFMMEEFAKTNKSREFNR